MCWKYTGTVYGCLRLLTLADNFTLKSKYNHYLAGVGSNHTSPFSCHVMFFWKLLTGKNLIVALINVANK